MTSQQALNALADAALGSDTPSEAFLLGYEAGHRDALRPVSSEEAYKILDDDTDEWLPDEREEDQ